MSKREPTPKEIAKSLRACWGPSSKSCDSCPVSYEHCSGLEVVAADLIEAQAKRIGELEAELAKLREENRWIPVEERLPETGEWCVVWTKVQVPTYHGRQLNKACFERGGWYGTGGRWGNVTHWRPMPKGPEVGHE